MSFLSDDCAFLYTWLLDTGTNFFFTVYTWLIQLIECVVPGLECDNYLLTIAGLLDYALLGLEWLWDNYNNFILTVAKDHNIYWKVMGTILWSLIFITYYKMKKS